MQNSEFVYFSSKSGKHMKQMLNPPFWGGVGVKKWSSFLDSAARSPIFGHLNIGTFGIDRTPGTPGSDKKLKSIRIIQIKDSLQNLPTT